MSTVGASATLGGLVDLNVLDDEVAGVKTLGVGVGLGVLQQSEQLLSRLDGPASLGDTECLACIPLELFHFKIQQPTRQNSVVCHIPHEFSNLLTPLHLLHGIAVIDSKRTE